MVLPVSTTANLLYIIGPGVDAYQYVDPDSAKEGKRNFEREEKCVIIEDIKGNENSVSLDTAGFQFYRGYPPKHTTFDNDEEIRQEYYPESAELIKKVTGASRVELFDHSELLRPRLLFFF